MKLTNIKYWGAAVIAFAISSSAARAQTKVLDIGAGGERTESGAFPLSGQPANGTGGTNYGPTATGGVVVTIDNLDQAGSPVGGIDWRDRGDSPSSDPLVFLGEDFVKNNAGVVRLTLDGVPAGFYTAVSYHHDPSFTQSSPIEVWLNDNGGAFVDTGVTGDAGAGGTGVPAFGTTEVELSSAQFGFRSDGVNPVVIVFDGRNAPDTEVPLSGFQWRELCLGVGLDAINWVDYPGASPLPLNGVWSYQKDPLDTVQINLSTTDPDTNLIASDPSRRIDGSEIDGWTTLNAATGVIDFPLMQYSATNTSGGDLVRFEIEYVFANSLPPSSNLVIARLNYDRFSGERTRIIATAYDENNVALPPSVLTTVANYDRVGRSGFESLAWDTEYNSATGEIAHTMPGLLSAPSINTDWLELTNTERISRIVFDVVDCTCVDTNRTFRIGVGKLDGRVRQGKYHGLIDHPTPDTYNTGSALIEVDRRGRFSSKFQYNGIIYRVGGIFNAFTSDWSGVATSPDGPPITVDMEFGPDPSSTILAINGTISGIDGTSTFSALLSPFTADGFDCELVLVGDYTAMIAPPSPNPGVLPEGWCFTSGQVQPSGRVALYTRTTDGIVGFAGGYVSGLETFGFHAKTSVLQTNNRRTNSIIGPLVFRNMPGISDFDGTVTVYKTGDTTNQTYYPAGYEADSALIGSLYVPDAGPTSFDDSGIFLDPAAGPAVFEGTDITITGPAATFTSPAFRKWTYYPTTGELSGTYNNVADDKKRAFGGVLFQKQDTGRGYAHGATINPASGTAVVRPFLIDKAP